MKFRSKYRSVRRNIVVTQTIGLPKYRRNIAPNESSLIFVEYSRNSSNFVCITFAQYCIYCFLLSCLKTKHVEHFSHEHVGDGINILFVFSFHGFEVQNKPLPICFVACCDHLFRGCDLFHAIVVDLISLFHFLMPCLLSWLLIRSFFFYCFSQKFLIIRIES